jgi:hypothetical protein
MRLAALIGVGLLAASNAAAEPIRLVGVMADVGVPDGATGSIVVRPINAVRLAAGACYNGVSTGGRVGVTLAPVRAWISPTLSLDYGRYPEGNANPLARRISGDETFESQLLERVGYDYANAHLGLDLGYRRVTFFIHAGMSFIRASIHNVDQVIQSDSSSSSSSTTVSVKQDPIIRAFTPSAKLGLIVYLW